MDENYLLSLIETLDKKNITLIEQKDISYGVMLTLSTHEGNDKLRIYQNNKGKITVDTSCVRTLLLKEAVNEFVGEKTLNKKVLVSPPLIGSDEAGKGDYFGPLCVCALYADSVQFRQLIALGAKDSKLLSDNQIHKLSLEIKKICPAHEIIALGNERFNQMYAEIKNMGNLLGWAHGKAIKNLLGRTACYNVLTDKYGSDRWLENRLKDEKINLVQQPKAEANPAVAAASILARDTFVNSIARISRTYDIEIPLGAGSNVDETAKEFLKRFGYAELYKNVKISFHNTSRILG